MSGTVTALKPQPEKISLAHISEPVVHLVSENDAFKHITIDGIDFIDWREPVSTWERDIITNCLKSLIGTAKTLRLGRMFKVSSLSENYHQLKSKVLDDYVSENDITEVNQPGLYAFFKILEGDQKALIDAYEARVADGVLEFNDFPLHFKADAEIIILQGEDQIGGVIDDVKFYSSYYGDGWNIEISVIHTLSGMPVEANLTIPVPVWSGTMPISELPIVPAEGELRAKLAARGRILAGIATGASYMRYKGEMTQTGWSGKTSFRADGRIMVDPRSCRRIDGDRYRNETRRTGLQFDENNEDKVAPFEIGEDDLWRTYPFVIGFSFRTKKWGTFRVADISPIDWRDDAFDYLVMDDNEKNIIKALVATRGQGFQDIVDEKGGGTIFLLEGKPGLGKTLTAETVAEMTRQPLYAISVGELGTDPGQLEKNLRTILDIASIWNAVLLLDEADIFLEARDTKDVKRNAMVGVLLRLLEYHDGILFLTTNRAGNIDPAFLSRISIPLSFPDAGQAKLLKIWENLTRAAGIASDISSFELAELSKHKINGRQIKNALKIGQTLARAEGRPITADDIRRPLEMSEKFHQRVRPGLLVRTWRRLTA